MPDRVWSGGIVAVRRLVGTAAAAAVVAGALPAAAEVETSMQRTAQPGRVRGLMEGMRWQLHDAAVGDHRFGCDHFKCRATIQNENEAGQHARPRSS